MASQPTALLSRPGVIPHPNGQLTQSPLPPPHDATPSQGPPPQQQQHALPNGSAPQQSPGAQQQAQSQQQQQSPESGAFQTLQAENAETWLAVGKLAEIMGDFDRAVASYDASLRHSPYSIPTLRAIANLYRGREMFEKAVDYYNSILSLNQQSGETWGSLGMCYSAVGINAPY